MRELVDGLRNAAGDPPPSSIDLDRLITGEYRRKRVRTGVTTVFAATALAALVAVPLVLTTGGGSTAPPASEAAAPASESVVPVVVCPSPEIPDPAAGDPAVLNGQVAPCLAAMLPGATLTDPVTKAPGVRFAGNRQDRYKATIQVDDAAGTGLLLFQYLLDPCRGDAASQLCTGPSNCPRAKSGGIGCVVRADGTKLFVQEGPVGPAQHNQLNVYRPDGTYLQLASTNGNDPHGFSSDSLTVTATHAPLTSAQLIQIADAIHLDK